MKIAYAYDMLSSFTAQQQMTTGKERDSESRLDYFGARYYGSALGRFTSPDWAASPEPIPYARLNNPQSLNLYAYVQNGPLSAADPDGHRMLGDGYSICVANAYGNGCSSGPNDQYELFESQQAQQKGAQAESIGLPQNGQASIYSDSFEGRPTASGDTFSQKGYTAALLPKRRWHAVPLRTRVEITHDGKSVVVEINDRGAGAKDGSMTRVLDITRAAASYLTGQKISNDNDINSVGLISITITPVPSTTKLGPVVPQEQ